MCVPLGEVLRFIGHFRGEVHLFCDIHAELRDMHGDPAMDFGPRPRSDWYQFVRARGYEGQFAPFELEERGLAEKGIFFPYVPPT